MNCLVPIGFLAERRALKVIFCILATAAIADGASYGDNCTRPHECTGNGLTCSPAFLCTCSPGYTYVSGEKECQATKLYPNEVFVPDLTFSSYSNFETDMTNEDLSEDRKKLIKFELLYELIDLFKQVTGFKGVDVTEVHIENNQLFAYWTVRLNREDPKFINATAKEIGDIVRPELEEASKRYKDAIKIDAMRWDSPKRGPGSKLALGVGLGAGLGVVCLVCVGLAIGLLLRRRRNASKPVMSISDGSSSFESGRSSKMDPDNYQYSVFMKDGYSLPPAYAKFVPPSLDGSSAYAKLAPPSLNGSSAYAKLAPPSLVGRSGYAKLDPPSLGRSSSDASFETSDKAPIHKTS